MDREYRVGIDLGGTNIKVGVVDGAHAILGRKTCKTRPFERSRQAVIADMADLCRTLLSELGIDMRQVEKLGVGSPGMIDHRSGTVVFAGNFGWNDVPLARELGEYFDVPVRLSNDANCAVLGEATAGAARGLRDVVMVTLGTGVGGGVLAGGVLQEGGSAGGMELGHALLVMDGEECSCGRRGCMEAYASASALARNARAAAAADPQSLMHGLCGGDLSGMNGLIPFKAARMGDAAAKGVVEYYIRCLGEGLINFINLWRPEAVLLGGGVANEGAPLLEPLNAYVRPRVFAAGRGGVPDIVQAALGNDAGIIGAAALKL